MYPRPDVRLKLSHKLALSLGGCLLFLLGLTALSLLRLESLSGTLLAVTGSGAHRSQTVRDLERCVNDYRSTLLAFGASDHGEVTSLYRQLQGHAGRCDTLSQDLAKTLDQAPDAQALLQQVQARAQAARQIIGQAKQDNAGRGEGAEAFGVRILLTSGQGAEEAHLKAWHQALMALSRWDDQFNEQTAQQAARQAAQTRWVLLGGAALALSLGVALSVWLVRDIVRGLQQALSATRRMADHDLSQPIAVDRGDELGEVQASLEDMRRKLQHLTANVREAASSIHQASGEIASGSNDLSGRTEQAAATLQLTLNTIETLTQSVAQTSGSSDQAQALARTANEVAHQGGQTVNQAVSTMGEVSEASRQIAEITTIIDGISFQTNILALNAAVEAARAGEAGKGFAVVAGEVRALAQRSAQAAQEIKQLIENSLARVTEGSAQVHQAGERTQEIVQSVERVSGIITAISAEARQQMVGIGETREAVRQLDSVAQHNAAMAEQSAAAAAALAEQAGRLAGLVGTFRLEHDSARAPA